MSAPSGGGGGGISPGGAAFAGAIVMLLVVVGFCAAMSSIFGQRASYATNEFRPLTSRSSGDSGGYTPARGGDCKGASYNSRTGQFDWHC